LVTWTRGRSGKSGVSMSNARYALRRELCESHGWRSSILCVCTCHREKQRRIDCIRRQQIKRSGVGASKKVLEQRRAAIAFFFKSREQDVLGESSNILDQQRAAIAFSFFFLLITDQDVGESSKARRVTIALGVTVELSRVERLAGQFPPQNIFRLALPSPLRFPNMSYRIGRPLSPRLT
jgi:hypothetical protein